MKDSELVEAIREVYSKFRTTLGILQIASFLLPIERCPTDTRIFVEPWRAWKRLVLYNEKLSIVRRKWSELDECRAREQLIAIDSLLFQEIGLREGRPESFATSCYRQLQDLNLSFFLKDLSHIVDEYSAYHFRDELLSFIESKEPEAESWLAKSPVRFQVLDDWLAREIDVLLIRETATAASGDTLGQSKSEPVEYLALWEYAGKTWARGSDFFNLCESLANGPANYSSCIESLIPNVSRTDQTRRFHSVVGSLNTSIRETLGLEVIRDKLHKEQVIVRHVQLNLSPKTRKKSPKRKR